ncbi:MAG: restriction endonuclease [Bacteroidetes bacterium]|nr:MAG: restriction endonuclease [Bacteroidota bacterium]
MSDIIEKFQFLERVPIKPQFLQKSIQKNIFVNLTQLADFPLKRISAMILPYSFPESVFPLGFDEIRYGNNPIEDTTVRESIKGVFDEVLSKTSKELHPLDARLAYLFFKNIHFRSQNGVWHDAEGLFDNIVPPIISGLDEDEEATEEDWHKATVESWSEKISSPIKTEYNILSLPQLWLPPKFGDTELHIAVKSILKNLHDSKVHLSDLHWRTLEEIVAEILHDIGLQVTITERSHDGGRDVIARGELIPGEPTLLAVEVKHRHVVPVTELRQSMWANRHFPALLFVTSGRFSAGVYKEHKEKDGKLRLFLKDGQGLSQWIDQYVRRNYNDPM